MDKPETTNKLQLDFTKLKKIAASDSDVLPVVVQDATSKEVLILAYANRLALEHSLETGKATFWSTSRNELWIKGATSGDYLELQDVLVNCEQNSLVYLVNPVTNAACHTGKHSCYYRRIVGKDLEVLEEDL